MKKITTFKEPDKIFYNEYTEHFDIIKGRTFTIYQLSKSECWSKLKYNYTYAINGTLTGEVWSTSHKRTIKTIYKTLYSLARSILDLKPIGE